ncbi:MULTISPECIES: heterocyst development glycosyltransferase HepC [Pseudanabaena]|uniref:Undecaprenyl-phosphate galactose phosphotransferase n=2 Tax=Pseudanabaena TaxID=1152 RepID=L8MW06_9CYAN|nr:MULTISPECIES: heterocyst development glycosyltransferase HepC [Pseudanabaena]ELS30984.1 Undecaprenyl-phosphate galactose phosphotransferase [Pseudanabaena biceps PCC 7429]MDG3496743.1 sugar transferase [Pseudanabaena catenata USMAC16]
MTSFIVNKMQVIELADSPDESSFISNLMLKIKQSKLLVHSFGNFNAFCHKYLSVTKLLIVLHSLGKNVNRSNVNLIRVEPEIGEAKLKNLADVCLRSQKDVYLNLPQADELPQVRRAIAWTIKRTFDWLAALVILIILSPVMLALAAIVASTSGGSVFFHQWRVGENGKLFRIIKFRTMIADADKLHHLVMSGQTGLHKCEDDPRITPAGRWMRKYSLDELPQLFNVLRGEMSLVGPRPWALYDALRISGDRQRRLNSLPGVTGAWQVSARSTMLDLDAVTDCDLSYLRDWTIWSDLKILLMTVPKVLSGFGAF